VKEGVTSCYVTFDSRVLSFHLPFMFVYIVFISVLLFYLDS
jgi:hypothetical protein